MHESIQSVVSSSILELEHEPKIPRYLVFCVGLDRDAVHSIRNSYRPGTSQSSSIIATDEYEVKIIGFYTQNLGRIFNSLGLSPNMLILGPSIQAPYPLFVKEWVSDKRPSIARISDSDYCPTTLEHDDYYLGTHSVIDKSKVDDSWRVSNEIDYGILVNLNYRRAVKIEDFDHHVVCLDDIDTDSSFDIASLKESSSFVKDHMSDTASAFFNDWSA